jgi:hypothetical protein
MALPALEIEITADPTAADVGLKKLGRSLDGLDKATRDYQTALANVNRAERSGLITKTAASKAIREAERAYQEAARSAAKYSGAQVEVRRASLASAQALQEVSRASRLSGSNLQNIGFQVGDFATQVGAGTSASQALGQQLPQLLGGFGPLGAVMGAVAAIGIPLGAAFFNMADGANALSDELSEMEPTLGSVRGSISALSDIQDAFNRAMATGGEVSGSAAAMIAANSRKEFEARKQVLGVELELLRIRGMETKQKLSNLESQQELARQSALQAVQTLGPGATGGRLSDAEGFAGGGARMSEITQAIDPETLRQMQQRRLILQKTRAEATLLEIAVSEVNDALNTTFNEIGGAEGAIDTDTGGAGGAGKTKTEERLSALSKSLMTEREALENWRAESLTALEDFNALELEALGGHAEAKLRIEEQYQQRLNAIRQAEQKTTLTGYDQLFGNLETVFKAGGDKMVGITKAFSVAQGLLNSYRAYTEVLADPALLGRPFLRQALAASTLAAGLAQVASMKSVSTSGGGGSASASASTAASAPAIPTQTVAINLQGDTFSRASVEGLLEQIQSQLDRGGRLVFQ